MPGIHLWTSLLLVAGACLLSINTVDCMGEDLFNYGGTDGNDYGQKDWSMVKCQDHATCPGWPDDWETYNSFIPYRESENMCKDCSTSTTGECKRHKQSPIHLERSITESRECVDRHWMAYKRGTCGFGRMRFSIERQSLRAYQPLHPNGDVACSKPSSIDFSWGFPNDWHLVHTDIKMPSEHIQDGKQYDAEVVLAHVYSKNRADKLIGKVAVFLEKGNETDRYENLDMYIRRWKRERRSVREACSAATGMRRDLDTHNATLGHPLHFDMEDADSDFQDRGLKKRRFHPYDWLKKVETEYYFRYEGSQGVPPCHEVVHWRVVKEPIRVAPSQIEQLEFLMANRIDPETCKRENAGRKRPGSDKVDLNREIQTTTRSHKVVFCECLDWESKKQTDLDWCKLSMEERGVKVLNNKKRD